MPIAEARKVLNDPKAYLSYIEREPDNSKCAYLASALVPDQIGIMFQDGVVARVDVVKPGIRTASGAEIGSTEDAVKRLYPGRISVEQHRYDPDGHYLRYTPVDATDRPYGMVFETDGKRVTSFRVGTAAAISLVEGCS